MNLGAGRGDCGVSRCRRAFLLCAEWRPGDGAPRAAVSRPVTPRTRPPRSARQVKGRGRRRGCPRGRADGGARRAAARGAGGALASRRSQATAEPGASLQRMLSPAAAAAPAAPSAGGGDARAPGSNGRAGLRARLLEAEGAPASPAWPGARTSAPSALAPAPGAARSDSDPSARSALPPGHPTRSSRPSPLAPGLPLSRPPVCPGLWGTHAVRV